MTINCEFIEHTFIDGPRLAFLLENTEGLAVLRRNKHAMLLTTCHRIELFTYGDTTGLLAKTLNEPTRIIRGSESVYRHLISIACGLRSLILGEKFITHQVMNAFCSLPPGNCFKEWSDPVLLKAAQLREEFGFSTTHDYEQTAFKMFDSMCLEYGFSRPERLLIIGGGRLAQCTALLASKGSFSCIYVISRSHKKVRRRLPKNLIVQVGNLASLDPSVVDDPFFCFIATDNLNGHYGDSLRRLLAQSGCQGIVDFSKNPLLGNGDLSFKPYVTMEDPQFTKEIHKGNVQLTFVVKKLKAKIENLKAPVLSETKLSGG